jgi:flavin reductase (DIM6/NTAB) family NADH-FMN oxidoreductase RutF
LERKIAKDAQKYFVTGVSMITSTGPLRDNVMAAEWTMQISYDPLLIAVFIHPDAATFKNIKNFF